MKSIKRMTVIQKHWRRPFVTIGAFAFVLLSTQSNAEEHGIDIFKQCGMEVQTTVDMSSCLAVIATSADEELQYYIETAQKDLDASYREYSDSMEKIDLSEENRHWEEYVRLYCGHVYHSFGTGTLRDPAARMCFIDLTRQRTHRIWTDFLARPHADEPVLPEPSTEQFGTVG
ncbi:lysozyme inhibitor LprI family protein [Kushneria sp. TE3]|uniref:lysozyme inhibitor LprI family protein n=1 Tax=Kushneria sp. TE3 TaxID=3449832 RepID=UPI003F684AFD